MCQAHQEEAPAPTWKRRQALRERFLRHLSGEAPLTDDELREMSAEMAAILEGAS